MRRTASIWLLLLVTTVLVPVSATAAAGDAVELRVTFRGDTPWLTSAEVTLPGGGTDPLVIDGALGTATATYQPPASPGGPAAYDLTDVVPVPADQPASVTAPNGSSADLPGVTVEFGPGTGQVTGTAGAGDTVAVTLVSGGQVLSQDVTADATTGAFTATFGAFDGTWEFGGSVTAAVSRTAADGTTFTLEVTRRLPDADITTQVVNAGPPPTFVSDAVFTDITPGLPFDAVGEPTTLTLATAEASFDPDAQDTVAHQGVTIEIDVPTLSVDAFDFGTDTVRGVAPSGATVHVLAATDAGVEEGTAVAAGDGTWLYEIAGDATAVAQVDAAVDHTDGARHHARGSFGDATLGEGAVLAFALLPIDTLVLLPFATGTGDTFDLTATTPAGTSTASVSGAELLAGLSPSDFSPPVDLAAGMDITIDQGGTVSSVRVPALTWSVDGSGTVTGHTDPGREVDVIVDVPVAGVTQSTLTGASGSGGFSFTVGGWTPGTEITGSIFPALNETEDLVFVIDQLLAAPRTHAIGADGGRAPGLGNTALVIESLGLLSASSQVPTAWRMDTVLGAGGPADLAVRYPAPPFSTDDGFFGTGSLTPIAGVFPVELTAGGTTLDTSPVAMTAYVPLDVAGALGTVTSSAQVLVDTGDGFEPVPADDVTVCVEDASADCDDFPVPYAAVADAQPGTYTVVDDRSVPNTLTVDRLYGGPQTGRIETAIALSKATFPDGGADAVVVASAGDFPDALAATPLAAAANAPILLNPTDQLHPAVEAEIERLGVDRAYVMGGERAIARSVAVAIGRNAGVKAVTRVAGGDRFATAAAAARWAVDIWTARGDAGAGSQVLVALGSHDTDPSRAWPDALVAGQLAGYAHRPILLVAQGVVPDSTTAALEALGTDAVTVIGGTAAIPDSTMAAIGPAGTSRTRLSGDTRYGTGVAIADAALRWGADPATVLAATGLAFPDGLTAAAAAYHQGGVLVLTDGDDPDHSPATLGWLREHAGVITVLRAVGGPAAISDSALEELVAAASTGATTVQRQRAGTVQRSAWATSRAFLR